MQRKSKRSNQTPCAYGGIAAGITVTIGAITTGVIAGIGVIVTIAITIGGVARGGTTLAGAVSAAGAGNIPRIEREMAAIAAISISFSRQASATCCLRWYLQLLDCFGAKAPRNEGCERPNRISYYAGAGIMRSGP
jgi:hypothetical protein